jgi:hypothetical protein
MTKFSRRCAAARASTVHSERRPGCLAQGSKRPSGTCRLDDSGRHCVDTTRDIHESPGRCNWHRRRRQRDQALQARQGSDSVAAIDDAQAENLLSHYAD